MRTLKRGIAQGLLLLLALMPFHAFLSVWLGHLTGHEAIIQAWKEALLVLMGIAAIVLVARDQETRDRLRSWPVAAVVLFTLIAFIVSTLNYHAANVFIFGAKTDLEFLVAFVLALLVADGKLVKTAIYTILISSTIVFAFSFLQVTILPANFLTHFGYGPSTIAPFERLDSTTSNLRFASTLGGPNQLGTFVLLPLALAVVAAVKWRKWAWLLLLPFGLISLASSYSRGAWIGAVAAAVILLVTLVSAKRRTAVIATLIVILIVGTLAGIRLIQGHTYLQSLIFHSQTHSDTLHLESITTGLTDTNARPLGHGLGSAGPAMFHTGTGLIIENYYLQLSYETGWLGLAAFLVLLGSLAIQLAKRVHNSPLALGCFAALIGVSITSLFLPAWTDSSTALIFWTAAGLALGAKPSSSHV